MKPAIITALFILLALTNNVFAQRDPHRYEVEILENPTSGERDTREVNSIIVFENEAVRIVSRRDPRVFKTFKYTEIKSVEHSFSRQPVMSYGASVLALTLFSGLPLFLQAKEKHWLSITAANDFAVLKLENDNFRLIRAEFQIRQFDVKTVNH